MTKIALLLVLGSQGQLAMGSEGSCPSNFEPLPASGSCPVTRSCATTTGCCGSCSGQGGDCFPYTCGETCQESACSACPALFDPLPSDETGSRPSTGSCPATRPYKTTAGCCGACTTSGGDVLPYDCGTTCSSTPGPGCSSTAPGTSSSPPPAAVASPPSSSPSCGSGVPACSEFCGSQAFDVTCASPKYGELTLTYQLSETIVTYTLSVGAKVDFDVRFQWQMTPHASV